MNLSRRTLLAASSATAVTAATALITSAGAAHASPLTDASVLADASAGATAAAGFDTLFQRAESLLTGGGFDPADTDFTAAGAALDTTAKGLWDTLDRSAGRTALWPDLAPLTDPGNFGQSYTRLRTVATAG
ncbi:hypothetical protein [Streptomyces sp. NBC_01591]|uniref:hypothetical protein n=1 Tax=Streptomyces sp. NBC_01591 TaxID=2975888 RepID=UPI002DD99168|nr:hypothetical protein [Streptomyces sp. NBC_01591]